MLAACLTLVPAFAVVADSVSERAAALAPHTDLQQPAGAGPHPLALLLPGCLGWHPHHTRWREQLLAAGYAVLHVDSFAARGLSGRHVLQREVCTGQAATGAERAGDVLAVLATLAGRDELDLARSLVFGWSHGGWTAFELLGRVAGGLAPPDLDALPPLPGLNVVAAFLFYPYCGPGNLAPGAGYPAGTRTLVLHGTRDRITAPADCRRRVRLLAEGGADIEFVAVQDAHHWFDNHAETTTYDAAATTRTDTRIKAEIAALRAAQP